MYISVQDDCPVKYIPNSLTADPSLISPDLPVASPEIEESVPAHEEESVALEALSDEFEEEEYLEVNRLTSKNATACAPLEHDKGY